MASQKDHIDNALNQLLAKKHQLESEVREIEDAVHTLQRIPSLLGEQPLLKKPASTPQPSSGGINRGLGDKVKAYLMGFPYSQKIDVGEMITELRKEHGVTGKKPSLYAYIHHLLKQMAAKHEAGLQYTKGVGYTRERAPLNNKEPDATLVHMS